uniref:Uncharacterized protein n=1 Tax=Myotis myotis TaxID=51298 RepID=A0A7J7ZYH0_MYOMY|nr:hypothetical protein mMyoMyo1_009799 [Myotis myotis]
MPIDSNPFNCFLPNLRECPQCMHWVLLSALEDPVGLQLSLWALSHCRSSSLQTISALTSVGPLCSSHSLCPGLETLKAASEAVIGLTSFGFLYAGIIALCGLKFSILTTTVSSVLSVLLVCFRHEGKLVLVTLTWPAADIPNDSVPSLPVLNSILFFFPSSYLCQSRPMCALSQTLHHTMREATWVGVWRSKVSQTGRGLRI